MTNLIVEISKYLMVVLFACYTYECFAVFRGRLNEEQKSRIFRRQTVFMYLIHLDAYLVVYAVTDNVMAIAFYVFQVIFVAVTISCYHLVYPGASRLLVNNMCMLLVTGFIMLTRLSFEKAVRQCLIALAAMVATLVIPFLIHRVHFVRRLTWLVCGCRDRHAFVCGGVWRDELRREAVAFDCRRSRSSRVSLSRSFSCFLWRVCCMRKQISGRCASRRSSRQCTS